MIVTRAEVPRPPAASSATTSRLVGARPRRQPFEPGLAEALGIDGDLADRRAVDPEFDRLQPVDVDGMRQERHRAHREGSAVERLIDPDARATRLRAAAGQRRDGQQVAQQQAKCVVVISYPASIMATG